MYRPERQKTVESEKTIFTLHSLWYRARPATAAPATMAAPIRGAERAGRVAKVRTGYQLKWLQGSEAGVDINLPDERDAARRPILGVSLQNHIWRNI